MNKTNTIIRRTIFALSILFLLTIIARTTYVAAKRTLGEHETFQFLGFIFLALIPAITGTLFLTKLQKTACVFVFLTFVSFAISLHFIFLNYPNQLNFERGFYLFTMIAEIFFVTSLMLLHILHIIFLAITTFKSKKLPPIDLSNQQK